MANVNDNNAVNGDHARATGERILFSMSVCGLCCNYVTRKYTNSIVVFFMAMTPGNEEVSTKNMTQQLTFNPKSSTDMPSPSPFHCFATL